MANSKELYANVTAQVITQMEKGVLPWVRPWSQSVGGRARMQPHNLASNRHYHGVNVIILSIMQGMYPTGAWATYKQLCEMGGQVRKGEKATHIVYFDKVEVKDRTSSDPDATKRIPLLRSFAVFNAAQADWGDVDPFKGDFSAVQDETTSDEMPDARTTINATGAMIRHGGDSAFYAPGPDRIQMPPRKAFHEATRYYAVMFHELTHWTAHASRCDRKLGDRFGNPAHAFEELVAELGAAFLCAEHGIDAQTEHANYLGHWLRALKDDDQAIFKAAGLAQKAATFIMACRGDAVQEAAA